MGNVLFEITEDTLETGMRGYPVGYCPTSKVDPEKGLIYVGYPVSEVAFWAPIEAIYLLYHGKKGSAQEVTSFYRDLVKRGSLSDELIAAIRKLPKKAHPMRLFSMALLMMETFEGKKDYREDCLTLIAKVPQLVAEVINHHAGWGDTPKPQPQLGYMENFTHMLNVPDANKQHLGEVLRLFNLLHYDHGGGNLSTFTGKAVASGLEDLFGSLAAAMCALAGPRHGRANQDCLAFVQEVQHKLGENADEKGVEQFLRDRLAAHQLVFGFGHAVLRVEDPRATVFYQMAERLFPDHPFVKTALHLRKVGPLVLKENPKISNPYPNVDAISGTILTAAGLPYPDYFTLLFGLSRCVGIAIQIVYERLEARGGKGTPIIRPKYLFKPR
ncbi:MAG: citrate (Si)-synthase [Verrucomicrobia bacterium]|nr:citrate (Si)-synthase [Verrucomicrobiota bacterium]